VLYGVCDEKAREKADEIFVVTNCDGGEEKGGCARDAL
jgi:hypothetical protein